MLQQKSNKHNIVALGLAAHLNGKYEYANKIMGALGEGAAGALEDPVDKSERLMYQNQLLEEKGDLDAALEHLDKVQDQVMDLSALKEKRVELALKKGLKDVARETLELLINQNPENARYHRILQTNILDLPYFREASESLSTEAEARAEDFYKPLAEKFPRSNMITQIRLHYTSGALCSIVDH